MLGSIPAKRFARTDLTRDSTGIELAENCEEDRVYTWFDTWKASFIRRGDLYLCLTFPWTFFYWDLDNRAGWADSGYLITFEISTAIFAALLVGVEMYPGVLCELPSSTGDGVSTAQEGNDGLFFRLRGKDKMKTTRM